MVGNFFRNFIARGATPKNLLAQFRASGGDLSGLRGLYIWSEIIVQTDFWLQRCSKFLRLGCNYMSLPPIMNVLARAFVIQDADTKKQVG